jgi:hypothetical protein
VSISRLEVPATDRAEIEAELDAALEAHDGELTRDLSSGEVTIARWAEGDPTRAMVIADRWAVRMERLALRRRLIETVYAERREPLDEWREQQLAAIEREEGFATGLLDQYQRDFHQGEKTTRLPHATLARRANRDHIEWDEDAALRYQRTNYPYDLTVRLNKSALKDRLQKRGDEWFDPETGEVADFLREVPPDEPESFTVKTEEKEV